MAYYLYKKIRSKRQSANPTEPERNAPIANTLREQAAVRGDYVSSPDDFVSALESEKATHNPIQPSQATENAKSDKSEKTAKRKYRWKVIAGLFFPMLVFSLNKTMIAAALPFIASDFEEFSQINWIIVAAELTATAFTASFAQFANVFGRYYTLQGSVLFMILGSGLCAGAPVSNFAMLLAGRGFQGLASAGTMVLTRIILSDKVSLKDNAVNNTVFSLVSGVGFGIGPLVGGYLTSVSWRWCFIINIPISVIGMILTHFLARPVMLGPQGLSDDEGTTTLSRSASFLKQLRRIDYVGQFLFLFGMGLFVLALTWAGSYYPWADVRVVAPLVVGSALLAAFLFWEYLFLSGRTLAKKCPQQRPMIAINLVWTRNAGILMYINLISGMAMYGAFYFVNLYFTIVKQFDSDKAGINLLFYLPGLGGGVYLAMFVCNVWPRKTWYPLAFGTIVEAAGITLLAASLHWGSKPVIYGMLAVTGLGTGVRYMPNTLHGVGYYREHIPSIVSLMSVATGIGSTLASTIMLNIFNNNMSSAGINLVHGHDAASSFSSINHLPQDEQRYVRQHAKDSIVLAFYGISSFMLLGVIAVAFLGNVNIKKHAKDDDPSDETANLTKGAYLGSLSLRRDVYSGENA